MSVFSKPAQALYLIALLPMYAGGLVYSVISEFMPYHAVAVGKSWDMLEPHMQILVISALNAAGGLILCNALAMTILLFIPFRQGQIWASWSITAIGCASMLSGLLAALHVDLNTPANPPWFVFLIVMFLLIAALRLSITHERNVREPDNHQ